MQLLDHKMRESRPLFHRGYQFLRGRNFDLMSPGATEDWSSDRIEFRNLTLGDIFLHGAAHVPRHLHDASNHRVSIHLRAFSDRDGGRFP
jgi:hypothetical protein